jgi:hypothetical protein
MGNSKNPTNLTISSKHNTALYLFPLNALANDQETSIKRHIFFLFFIAGQILIALFIYRFNNSLPDHSRLTIATITGVTISPYSLPPFAFSPSRLLAFSPSRLLAFSPSRLLAFSPSRLLAFSPSPSHTFGR